MVRKRESHTDRQTVRKRLIVRKRERVIRTDRQTDRQPGRD